MMTNNVIHSNNVYRYTIPIRPVSINRFYRTTKNGRIYICKSGQAFKTSVNDYMAKNYPQSICLECPISLTIHLNFKDRRRLDTDNYLKPLIDSLNKILWKDDFLIYEIHVSKSPINIMNNIELEIKELNHIKVPEIQRTNQKQYQKPYYCECGVTLTSKKNLKTHLNSKKHIMIIMEMNKLEPSESDLDEYSF